MFEHSLLRAFLPLLALGLSGGILLLVWGRRASKIPVPASLVSRLLVIAAVALNGFVSAQVTWKLVTHPVSYLLLLIPVAAPLLALRTGDAGRRVLACAVAMLVVTGFGFFASFSVGMAYAPSIVVLLLAGLLSGARTRPLTAD